GAALKFVTDHASASADTALFDRAAVSSLDGTRDMFRLHMKTINVLKPAIPGLGDDRQAPGEPFCIRSAMGKTPRDHSVARDSHAMRIRQHDRTFEESALFHPGGSGHFTVAI